MKKETLVLVDLCFLRDVSLKVETPVGEEGDHELCLGRFFVQKTKIRILFLILVDCISHFGGSYVRVT